MEVRNTGSQKKGVEERNQEQASLDVAFPQNRHKVKD